jgi:Transposase DDE domain group 1
MPSGVALILAERRPHPRGWCRRCDYAMSHTWTRLSCHSFATNAVRLQLHVLAYNLGNFMRTLAMPKTAEPWSLTSLREKLIKIGAKGVSHGRYVTFQMAEVALPRQMFPEILSLIARLRAPPGPA